MVDLRSLSRCRRSSGKTLCFPFTLQPPLAHFSTLHYFFQFIVTTMRYIRFATAAILAAVPFSNAYGVNLPKPVSNVKATSPSISRQNFLAVMAGGLSAGLISNEAWAKDADSKGTKKDPVFEACLSQCELQWMWWGGGVLRTSFWPTHPGVSLIFLLFRYV